MDGQCCLANTQTIQTLLRKVQIFDMLYNVILSGKTNDPTIGWQKLNLLSHSNATLVPQARQARASGENLNYMTLAPQASIGGEIVDFLLSHYFDILNMYDNWLKRRCLTNLANLLFPYFRKVSSECRNLARSLQPRQSQQNQNIYLS